MSTHPSQKKPPQVEDKIVVENRQARHLYFVEELFEAGLVLEGWEVKSILRGAATFNGGAAFIRLINGEAFLDEFTITPLPNAYKGLTSPYQANRLRKLLLKKEELKKLGRKVAERGYTIVPLAIKKDAG